MHKHHSPLTLFILKKFHDYEGNHQISNGLKTSAAFVVELLLAEGHRALLVEAVDGNCVDRLVTEHQTTRVVLEAIWVTPAKLAELKRLHPSIRWTVRVHSEVPFLANEGMAIGWIADYMALGVEVAFNSAQTVEDFHILGPSAYLPNYYPLRRPRPCPPPHNVWNIGCFGAIRPLKNQLMQAFAAVRFGQITGKRVRFHMNSSRLEQSGSSNLKNIIALMKASGNELVQHPWLTHHEFLELVGTMHICLQVSLSESFNITSSDAVSMGIPLIGSDAISWLPRRSRADVDSSDSITRRMLEADATTVHLNHEALENYLESSVAAWDGWMKLT